MRRQRARIGVISLSVALAGALAGGGCGDIPIPLRPPDGHRYLVSLGPWDYLSPEEVEQAHDHLVVDQLGFQPAVVSDRIEDENDQAGSWYDKWLELLQKAPADSAMTYGSFRTAGAGDWLRFHPIAGPVRWGQVGDVWDPTLVGACRIRTARARRAA